MFESVGLLWPAIVAMVVVAAAVRTWIWPRASSDPVLGTVSDQWLAEERMNRPGTR